MILDDIVVDKRKRLEEHKSTVTPEDMKTQALSSKRTSISFYDALHREGLSIIGEFKKASPSLGTITSQIPLTERIRQYSASVDAISCLTEEDHFHGSAEYLKEIRQMTELPIIRKDFIIDDYQIYEAKVIGADAILLIAAILDDETMKRFYDLAYELGLDVLLEVHDAEEMARAVNIRAKIIGVNNRNLKDFSIDLKNTAHMLDALDSLRPDYRPVFVSESGVTTTDDIRYLKKYQIDALLIGRAFMESPNPEALAGKWKGVYQDEIS